MQGHEHRDVQPGRGLAHARHQSVVQRDLEVDPLEALAARPTVIRRQGGQFRRTGQLVVPVAHRLVESALVEQRSLPHRVVGELHCERLEDRRLTAATCAVRIPEIPGHRADGSLVDKRMMQRHSDNELVVAAAHDHASQGRVRSDGQWPAPPLLDARDGLVVAASDRVDVVDLQPPLDRIRRRDDLHDRAVVGL